MTLESGPARTDRNWQLLRAAIFVGFAAYFGYDGFYGYPQGNRTSAETGLQAAPFHSKADVAFDRLPQVPDEPDFERLKKLPGDTREQAHKLFGNPTWTDNAADYFISRYGYIIVPRSGTLSWHPWYKTRSEIVQQYACTLIAAIPGLYFLWRMFKAATLRVVIDDEGMTYAGRRIAFADMTSLRDYSPKGWIDLYYQSAGRERKLRLDNEKVARFDELVAAICEAKGFRNEVQVYAERKARQEAEEAAAQAAEAEPDQPADAADSLADEADPKDS